MSELWINKLKLLCWKNWITLQRKRFCGVLELLFPIIIIISFLIIRNFQQKSTIEAKPSIQFNINPPLCQYRSKEITKLAVLQTNKFYDNEVNLIGNVVKNFNVDLVKFDVLEALTDWVRNQTEPVAVVIFEQSDEYPVKHLKYTIKMPDDTDAALRWNTDKFYHLGMSKEPSFSHQDSLYYSTCFLKLQNEIDHAFIKALNNGSNVIKLRTLRTFPYPEKEVDASRAIAVYWIPISFALSVIFSAAMLIKNITIESKSRLTELMKIMGLSSSLYWSSWFMRSFIILLISFTINLILTVTSIISDVPMFANSNPLIIWIFFISYITSMITFCFLVSVIFKKSSRAEFVGSILFIATFLPYIMYHDSFYRFSYGLKALFCMLTNTNMSLGIKMVLMSEISDGGVGFGTLFERSVDLKFSVGELLFFMNIGSVLQMLLTIYVEKVDYDQIEFAKLWNDFISFVYIKLNSIKRPRINSRNGLHEVEMRPFHSKPNDKEVLENLGDEIVIKDLSKKIGKEYAVQNMSLNLNKNQITVLLGPKRAGKTTVLALLTGLCKPTSGTVIINGYDITTNLDKARSSMGVCLQYNALFEQLTVQENLEFFCKLKEMSDMSHIQNQIQKYANLLGIFDVLSKQIKTLNDEQKKKLSIAIALCGDSKFIILDEPLSGIDESSRQQLWDLLNSEKDNRTFLITANFMDDIPGDNIAIITEGQLKTVDSLANLKKKFEIGYRLICDKENGFKSQAVLDMIKNAVKGANTKPVADAKISKQDQDMKDAPQSDAIEVEVCDDKVEVLEDKEESDKMEKTMQKDYSPVSLEYESETEAVFAIPEDNLPVFDNIFKSLESLKISTMKCSYTSQEDVIVRMSFENNENVENSNQISKIPKSNEDQTVIDMKEPEKEFEKCDKNFAILQQFYAMFLKKYFVLRQSWIMLISIGIASLLTILLTPKLFSVRPDKSTQLQISFNSYGDTEILGEFESNSTISDKFITLFSETDKIARTSTKIEAEILEKYKNPQSRINKVNLIAASFKNDDIVGWFNTQPYHTMPLTVNTINRAILKSVAGNDYDISVANHPFNFKDLRDNSIVGFFVIVFLLVAWPLIYIGNYIKERKMRFKFLQFICGINRLVFWFTNIIFDYILFNIICLVMFLCFVCFNYEMNQWLEEFGILMTVGSSYGFSWICFIYAFSYFFSKPSNGESMLLFSSIILSILSEVDNILYSESADLFFVVIILRFIGMMFAPFSLVKMIHEVYSGTRPFDHSTHDDYIVMNFASGCIFFLIVLLTDYKVFTRIYYKLKKPTQNSSLPAPYSDNAILKEENQVVNSVPRDNIEESALLLKSLMNTFKNITAVNQLSINDEQNAANMKTTFKIINGDESITSGDVWIKRKSLKTQFDNFIPELTGRKILKIFALIRGIKMDRINQIIKQKAVELKLEDNLDKKIKNYSGGDRKKLFALLALLGYPDVLFLDECKTADDRNKLMKISKMDECEALSTRIGIMITNQFQCLGSVKHLKDKFSKGFVLTIKTGFTDEDKIRKLREVVVRKFLDVELKGKYLDILTFHLKNVELKYSEIFKILSEVKEEMAIKDYKLTHMSLEQVILNISKQETPFAKEEVIQIAEEEEKWKKEEEAERNAKIKLEIKMEQKANKKGVEIGKNIAKRREKEQKQKELDHQENEDKIEFGKKTKKLKKKLGKQKEKDLAKQEEKKQKEQIELERIEMDKNNQKEIEDKETKKLSGKSPWAKTMNWISSPSKNRNSVAKKSNKTENKQKDKRQDTFLTGRPMNEEESIKDSSNEMSDGTDDLLSK